MAQSATRAHEMRAISYESQAAPTANDRVPTQWVGVLSRGTILASAS